MAAVAGFAAVDRWTVATVERVIGAGSVSLSATLTDSEGRTDVDAATDAVLKHPVTGNNVAHTGLTVDAGGLATATFAAVTDPGVGAVNWKTSSTVVRTDPVDFVGQFLVGLDVLRQSDSLLTRASDEALIAGRNWASKLVEERCGRAFRLRGFVDRVETGGASELLLRTPDVSTVKVVGMLDDGSWDTSAIIAAADLVWDETGRVATVDGSAFPARVLVSWQAGTDSPPPDIVRAVTLLVRHGAQSSANSSIPDRATSMVQAGTDVTFRLAVAGRNGVTGIGEIDEVIEAWRWRGNAGIA